MTVQSTSNKIDYTGDGVTTGPYSFIFPTLDTWIFVYVESVIVSDTDYVLSVSADQENSPGGSITFNTAVADQSSIVILRTAPLTQESDYNPYDSFPSERAENDFDKSVIIDQQQQEILSRAFVLPVDSTASTQLPEEVGLGYWRWNAAGTEIEYAGAPGIIIPTLSFGVVIDMISAINLEIGDLPITYGYNTRGDGGDNYYEIVAAATGIDDGGTYIDLSNGLQAKGLFPLGFHNVKQWGAVGDGVTGDTTAINAANAAGDLFFPPGTYISNSTPTNKCAGEGAILKLFSRDDMVLDSTYQFVGSDETGTFDLLNTSVGINAGKSVTVFSTHATVAIGDGAMQDNVSSARITAVGNFAAQKLSVAHSVDAVGASAMQSSFYNDSSSAFGANASKWNGSADPVADLHDFYNGTDDPYDFNARWPTWRADWAGLVAAPAFIAAAQTDSQKNTSVGRNALLHGILLDRCVAVGYNTHAHALNNTSCTSIGSGAIRDMIKGDNIVAVGTEAGQQIIDGLTTTVVGALSMRNVGFSEGNTTLGYAALNGESASLTDTPLNNVAIGPNALREFSGNIEANIGIGNDALRFTEAVHNVAIGDASQGVATSGNRNTSIGSLSLFNVIGGEFNSAIGYNALRFTQSGGSHENFNNCSGLGNDTRIAGNNEVQLGDAATTTWAYGPVQNRSDVRDKADIAPLTDGHVSFILDVDWRIFRWDMRDDYMEVVDGVMVFHEQDGSKKRTRLHAGAIAQEVKVKADAHGIDFAGYKDCNINGGCDVLGIGYTEFIPYLGELCKRQQSQIDDLISRIEALEGS